MAQKFYAHPGHKFTWPNGAIGFRTGSFCVLGPYARVQNCPVKGLDKRLTCYATGHADTAFSVPACTRIADQHIGGFFMLSEQGIEFCVYDRFRKRAGLPVFETVEAGSTWHIERNGATMPSPNFPSEYMAAMWLQELHRETPIMSSEKAHSRNEGQMA